jgi:hypothetical protein
MNEITKLFVDHLKKRGGELELAAVELLQTRKAGHTNTPEWGRFGTLAVHELREFIAGIDLPEVFSQLPCHICESYPALCAGLDPETGRCPAPV